MPVARGQDRGAGSRDWLSGIAHPSASSYTPYAILVPWQDPQEGILSRASLDVWHLTLTVDTGLGHQPISGGPEVSSTMRQCLNMDNNGDCPAFTRPAIPYLAVPLHLHPPRRSVFTLGRLVYPIHREVGSVSQSRREKPAINEANWVWRTLALDVSM